MSVGHGKIKWTPDRIELLRKLHAGGYSAGLIVPRFGGVFSRSAVLIKMWRLGLDGKRYFKSNKLAGRQTKWTEAQKDILRRMRREGFSYEAIARQIGVSKSSASAQGQRSGLAPPEKRRQPEIGPAVQKMRRRREDSKPKPPTPATRIPLPPNAHEVRFVDAPNGVCKFISGGEATHANLVCGAPALPCEAWCAYHHRIVYVPHVMRMRAA